MGDVLRLYSVTSLLGIARGKSAGLHNWALRQQAGTAIEAYELLGQMRARDPNEAVDWLAKSSDRYARRAADRGTALHDAFEAIALGQTPTIPEGAEAFVEQYARWLERWQPEFLLAEAPVYNLRYRYAGTLDGIMVLNGRELLFDYKTTEHSPDSGRRRPPFSDNALQLVAYKNAEWLGVLHERRYASGRRYYLFDPAAKHEPMPAVDGALVITISPYDCFATVVRVDEAVWDAFLACVDIARFELEMEHDLFAPVVDWQPPAQEVLA